jgi:hypothetical protein
VTLLYEVCRHLPACVRDSHLERLKAALIDAWTLGSFGKGMVDLYSENLPHIVEGYKPSAEPVVAYWQAVWEIVMVAGAKSLRLVHVLLNIAESNSWQLYEEQVPEVERQDLPKP